MKVDNTKYVYVVFRVSEDKGRDMPLAAYMDRKKAIAFFNKSPGTYIDAVVVKG